MTREKKNLFNLSDVQAIRFTCKKCGSVQAFPIKEWAKIPQSCCNEAAHMWIQSGSTDEKIIWQLREALQSLIKYNGNAAYKLQLELEADEEAKPKQ